MKKIIIRMILGMLIICLAGFLSEVAPMELKPAIAFAFGITLGIVLTERGKEDEK